jgi:hypothetical protein
MFTSFWTRYGGCSMFYHLTYFSIRKNAFLKLFLSGFPHLLQYSKTRTLRSVHLIFTDFSRRTSFWSNDEGQVRRFNNRLTLWKRVLPEKLTVPQLVKKFPAFCRTQMFITAFTSYLLLSLSRATSIQSIPLHYTSWRSILILFSHICLGIRNRLLPSGFPTKTLYTFPVSHTCLLY